MCEEVSRWFSGGRAGLCDPTTAGAREDPHRPGRTVQEPEAGLSGASRSAAGQVVASRVSGFPSTPQNSCGSPRALAAA